ncbi:MAG: BtrH N-terminal domain-containing protein [Frankiaceae bacterium]
MSATRTCTLDGVRFWRHDLVGCLWTSAGTLLDFHGAPVLETLGAAWGFLHLPQDLRREEYYYPCRPGASLWEAIAPYHPISSKWHEPAGDDEAWSEVRDEVLAGRPVICAVDNFDLPFRPAYQDVHTNHLSIVYGFDEDRGTVRVLDAVPPRFDGDIKISELMAARGSGNPLLHDRDMFFTNAPIANRWLEVSIDADDFPAFTPDHVRSVIRRNVEGFRAGEIADGYVGLEGELAYLRDVIARLREGEEIWEELFLVAGAVLANTALHADWLALAGRQFGIAELSEVGREVERVAHHWSTVRIMSVLTRNGAVDWQRLDDRITALHHDHVRVVGELERLLRRI